MKNRTWTGVFITIFVYGILLFSGVPAVITCAAALLGVTAVYEIFKAAGIHQNRKLLVGVCIIAAMVICVPLPNYATILCVLLPVICLFFIWLMRNIGRKALNSYGECSVIAMMVVLLIKAIPVLRSMDNGFFCLFAAVTTCFITDVAAYYVGRSLGKRKLAPVISPNKTVAGSIGGIIAAAVSLLLLGSILASVTGVKLKLQMYVLYICLASIAGQFGDLCMSALKRNYGVKDFGTVLPGHGGILDRFDSQILAIPITVVFLCLTHGFIVA